MSYRFNKPEPCFVKFSWDSSTLQRRIKDSDSKYHPQDPRTWPTIPYTHFEASPGFRKPPPIGVAYDKKTMDILLQAQETWKGLEPLSMCTHPTNKSRTINWKFRCYPFNFKKDGAKRSRIGLSKTELEQWMDFVNGPNWASKFPFMQPKEKLTRR
jgi:hypothetical protein